MKTKTVLPALLALSITVASVAGSACFTAMAIDSARTQTEIHAPALRVQHCYLNDRQQLVVVVEGGVWQQGNPRSTPHAPMSFALDLLALAKERAKAGGIPTLPQTILKPGVPEADFLQRGGYREIVFSEQRDAFAKAVPPPEASTQARVEVIYQGGVPMQPNLPASDYVGIHPVLKVHDVPGAGEVAFSIADINTRHHFGSLLLVPLAVPLDVVTSPLQLIFLLTYKGG